MTNTNEWKLTKMIEKPTETVTKTTLLLWWSANTHLWLYDTSISDCYSKYKPLKMKKLCLYHLAYFYFSKDHGYHHQYVLDTNQINLVNKWEKESQKN